MGARSGKQFVAAGLVAFLVGVGSAGCSSPEKVDPAANSDSSSGVLPSGDAPPTQDPTPPRRGGAADQLADDILRGDSLREKEAQFYLKQANRWYSEADYVRAEELYRKALDLDPNLAEAKEKLVRSMMFLGKRDGEIRSMVRQFGDEVQVGKQQRLIEARRLVERARKSLDADDADKAVRDSGRAREMLLWFDYGSLDVSDLEREAEDIFNRGNQRQREMTDTLRERRRDEARSEALELERAETRRQRDRIENLLERVRHNMKAREFEQAARVCDTILELDPNQTDAKRFRHRALEFSEALRYIRFLETDEEETQKTWESLAESGIPYDQPFRFGDYDYWRDVVKQRGELLTTVQLDESREIREIKRVLATQQVSFNFDAQSLSEVVGFLRTISGLNITIDPAIDAVETKVDLQLQGVVLQEALDLILKNTGLAYTYKENTLYVTEQGKAFGSLIFDIYNVTDILNKIRDFPGPSIQVRSNDDTDEGGASPFEFGGVDADDEIDLDPDQLAELIKESTGGEDIWETSNSTIVPHKGQILVTSTRELHLAVKSFLENLRKDSDLFVIVEARFIDMFDDFLEDIGIDSRNLGQPPGTGFGTAYGTLNSNRSGGIDYGFGSLGNPTNPSLVMGQDRVAGRIQHILDGFVGAAQGSRLNASSRGLSLQVTWLDPYQINAILRASQEHRVARTVNAPRVTASNGQRVNVSIITQRAYVQDYELVSGGTGLVVQEVADPVVDTFQDGVILDVQPVISADRKFITIDVRPTLASLVNGVISTVTVSLGSLTAAATLVDIDLPEITLQQAFTSVTVPDGGTVLLGGFRALNERRYESFVPFVGRIPLLKNLFRRKAYLNEKRSLYILLTAKVVDLRSAEKQLFN